MSEKYLAHINYDFPKKTITQELDNIKFSQVQHPITKEPTKGMFVAGTTPIIDNIASDFIKHFNINYKYRTGLLKIQPNTTLPWHKDIPDEESSNDGYSLLCAVNIILFPEENVEPVEFRDESGNIFKYHYSAALLNIHEEHRVVNTDETRIILRIFFLYKDASFDRIKDLLK